MVTAAVVNFCSNDLPFLAPFLQQLSLAVSPIIIPVCDHFFDGSKEQKKLLETAFSAHPEAFFLLYPFAPSCLPKSRSVDQKHLWASVSRLLGYSFLPKNTSYTFFLDVDEIPEGNKLQSHIEAKELERYDFAQLGCYWYFREACYRADTWESTPLVAKNSALSKKLLLQKDERLGTYQQGRGIKNPHMLGQDQTPLFHHYSWVRTKEAMQKKVASWGHSHERNWADLVAEEFSKSFTGKDFVHGYSFQKVEPFCDFFVKKPAGSSEGNVVELSKIDLFLILHRPRWMYPFSLKEKISLAENHFSIRS